MASRGSATDPSRRLSQARRSSRCRVCDRPCAVRGSCSDAFELRGALLHRRVEAASVCGVQMDRNDELEARPERLLGGKAEQRRSRAIPPPDRSRPIREDGGIAGLIEKSLWRESICLAIRTASNSAALKPIRFGRAIDDGECGERKQPRHRCDSHQLRCKSGRQRRRAERRRRRDTRTVLRQVGQRRARHNSWPQTETPTFLTPAPPKFGPSCSGESDRNSRRCPHAAA